MNIELKINIKMEGTEEMERGERLLAKWKKCSAGNLNKLTHLKQYTK